MEILRLFSCLLVILAFSGCAVISKNNDLFITQKLNPSETLNIQLEELENLRPADTGGQSLFGGGGFGSLNPREVGRRVIEDRRRAEELNRRRSKDLFSGFY